MVSLAANIRAERARRRWSQEYVAERIGLSPRTLVDIEAGKSSPRVETVAALAELFGVPMQVLIDESPALSSSKGAQGNSVPAAVDPGNQSTDPAHAGPSIEPPASGDDAAAR